MSRIETLGPTMAGQIDERSEGGGTWLLVVSAGAVQTHDVPKTGQVSIGRSDLADIRLDDPSVSREHAIIRVGEEIEVEDLGSANGTLLAGEALEPNEPMRIDAMQALQIGPFTLLLQRGTRMRAPRRLLAHGHFEARLEDECQRARMAGEPLALLRVRVEGKGAPHQIEEAMTSGLRDRDVVAAYAPGEYEMLLVETTRARADAVASRVESRIKTHGLDARLGVASCPEDGYEPDALLARAGASLRQDLGPSEGEDELVFRSAEVRDLVRIGERVGQGTIAVMLLGETGVGKEVFAELIHRSSPRANGPFVRINCAALSDTLLESELFGHERGAFTGAEHAKIGLLEAAAGGTVFLDELGEMPTTTQAKVLRAIEQKQVVRVGAVAPRDIDVRFISATNKDLNAAIDGGGFRADLLFRLNGVVLEIPPLRARVSEIKKLAEVFLGRYAAQMRLTPTPRLSERALDLLERYDWPGNIRELRNVMERAVLLCTSDRIEPEHLPLDKMTASWRSARTPVAVPDRAREEEPISDDLSAAERAEREELLEALERCHGNQTRAAALIGVSRRTLTNRMNKYGTPRPRKRT